ncbi:MAG: phage baseplate assembly protein V, partial [Blastocatellia bacterium]
PAVAETKVLKTEEATITLSDLPGAGGVTIETKAGMKIKIDVNGIEINDGQGGSVKLSGTQVSINNGALEVM